MLSENQQKMVLKMYMKYATIGDGTITKNDVTELYGTRAGFYNAMMYLVRSGFVEKIEFKTNVVQYKLTLSGQLLARLLCSLVDNPNEVKNLKFVLRF
jgi:hypothetical protein